MSNRNRTHRANGASQRFNQPPKARLNGKHSVTIRFGAMHNDVTVDGHTVDLSRRDGESFKDTVIRQNKAASDLAGMVFSD